MLEYYNTHAWLCQEVLTSFFVFSEKGVGCDAETDEMRSERRGDHLLVISFFSRNICKNFLTSISATSRETS